MAIINSVRTGYNEWALDCLYRDGLSSASVLISGWFKPNIPDVSYPRNRGNANTFYILGENWHMIYLIDNLQIESTGYLSWYNSNSMFNAAVIGSPVDYLPQVYGGVYAGDYSTYVDTGAAAYTEAEAVGWKWFGVQLIKGASDFTTRLWLKMGSRSIAKIAEQTMTLTTLRADLVTNGGWTSGQAASWSPTNIKRFMIGDGTDGTWYMDATHCRVSLDSSEPSLSTLESIAALSVADTSAWGDYELKWSSGAADLADRSGNSRTLTNEGTLYQGSTFNDGSSPFLPIFRKFENTLLRR